MNAPTRCIAHSTLAIIIAAGPALADVTAEQVWSDWRNAIERSGADVTFEKAGSDGILTINDLVVTLDGDMKTGADIETRIRLGAMVFQELGNGSVQVLLPTDAPIVVESREDKAVIRQSNKDFSLIVSGTVDDITYRYSATEFTLALTEYLFDDTPADWVSAKITLTDLSGFLRTRDGDLRQFNHNLAFGKLAYSIAMNLPGDPVKLVSEGSIDGLQSNFDIAVPAEIEDLTANEAFDAGFAANGSIIYDNISANITSDESGNKVAGSGSAEAGKMLFSLGRGDDGIIDVSQSLSFGPTKVQVDGKEEPNNMLFARFAINSLNAGAHLGLPENFDRGVFGGPKPPLSDLLKAGFFMAFDLGYDGLSGTFSFKDGENDAEGTVSSTLMKLAFSVAKDAFRVSSASKETEVGLTSNELPFGPIQLSLAKTFQEIEIPVSISQDPNPFTYHEEIVGLSISDNLWDLFDPEQALPRTALSYILNVTGTGNWLIEPFSDEFASPLATEPKGELHSLTLNELRLSAAGAELTGAGDFTFNNDDLTSYRGLPAPIGTLDLKLTGINRLIDSLIEIGLLTSEEALPIRVGLAGFTVKGDGDDTLISHFEATSDGKFLSNGKRMK